MIGLPLRAFHKELSENNRLKTIIMGWNRIDRILCFVFMATIILRAKIIKT
jgi:hypothetical protein